MKTKPKTTDADRAWHHAHPAFEGRNRWRLDDNGVEIVWNHLGQRVPGGWEVCKHKTAKRVDDGPVAVGYVLVDGKWVIDQRLYEVQSHRALLRPPIDLSGA